MKKFFKTITIAELAKENECEQENAYGLAEIWDYWVTCNSCDKQSINEWKSLENDEQEIMFNVAEENFPTLYRHLKKYLFV